MDGFNHGLCANVTITNSTRSRPSFYQWKRSSADLKQWGCTWNIPIRLTPTSRFQQRSSFPPEIEVESPYLKRRQAKLQAQSAEIVDRAAARLKFGQAETVGL